MAFTHTFLLLFQCVITEKAKLTQTWFLCPGDDNTVNKDKSDGGINTAGFCTKCLEGKGGATIDMTHTLATHWCTHSCLAWMLQ